MARRKSFQGQEWAKRDLNWIGLVAALVLLGAVNVRFLYAAIAVLVAFGGLLGVRALRRRRVERANADAPFWLDDVRQPPG